MKQIQYILPLIGLFLLVAGCSQEKRPEGMPPLMPCTFTFVQEGVPLADASVTFMSDDPALQAWNAGGVTDKNGVCKPQTRGSFPGIPAGIFKILVSKIETEPSDLPAEAEQSSTYRLVDIKFSRKDMTPLEVEITQGKNVQTFNLGPAVKELIPFEDTQ